MTELYIKPKEMVESLKAPLIAKGRANGLIMRPRNGRPDINKLVYRSP